MNNYHPQKRFPPNSKIFIRNFDHVNVSEKELRKVFSKYGEIQGRLHLGGKGFTFIQFESFENAAEAKKGENGRILGTRQISIEFAHNTNEKVRFRSNNNNYSTGGRNLNFSSGKYDDALGKRRRSEVYYPNKKFKGEDDVFGKKVGKKIVYLGEEELRVPIFCFDSQLASYAKYLKQEFLSYGNIKADIHHAGGDYLQNVPSEKYLVYIFHRNQKNQSIYFCAISDDGKTPGFVDTPVKDVINYMKNDFAKKQKLLLAQSILLKKQLQQQAQQQLLQQQQVLQQSQIKFGGNFNSGGMHSGMQPTFQQPFQSKGSFNRNQAYYQKLQQQQLGSNLGEINTIGGGMKQFNTGFGNTGGNNFQNQNQLNTFQNIGTRFVGNNQNKNQFQGKQNQNQFQRNQFEGQTQGISPINSLSISQNSSRNETSNLSKLLASLNQNQNL